MEEVYDVEYGDEALLTIQVLHEHDFAGEELKPIHAVVGRPKGLLDNVVGVIQWPSETPELVAYVEDVV
jgi:hypothetical protein